MALEGTHGLVSLQGAESGFGVVYDEDETGTVDTAATERRREQRCAHRAERSVFNMGPPMAEIVRDCETQTGLPTPLAPGTSPA